MGLLQTVARRIIKAADMAALRNISPWQVGQTYYPDISYASLVKKYTSYVYACAHHNAISCAYVPLRLYAAKSKIGQKSHFCTRPIDRLTLDRLSKARSTFKYVAQSTEVEEVLDHPLLNLLQNVNEQMGSFDLFESLFLHLDLTGNAYWYLKRDPIGLPISIQVLFPQYVKIVPDERGGVKHYEYGTTFANKITIQPDNVEHFKNVNPDDSFYGLGPLQACVVAADLSTNMNTYETSLFENRAHPDYALVLPAEAGEPNDDAIKRLHAQYRKQFRGVKKGGKMAVLSGGAELKPLQLSPKEMAFLQGRKATLQEIAAIFGVPLSKLTVENVNRANAESGDYTYAKDTVAPRLVKVQDKINERLTKTYDERLFVAFDNPVPADKEFMLKEQDSHLKNGYTSINEEREKDGLTPVEWGEVPLLPMTLMPVGSAPSAPMPEKTIKTKTPRRHPPLARSTNFVNAEFVTAMQEYFAAMRKDALAAFDRDFKSVNTKIRANDYLGGWFDLQRWNGKLLEQSEPFVRATFMAGGERAIKQLVKDAVFEETHPGVARTLDGRTGRIGGINATKLASLRKTIVAGMDANEGVSEIRKRIEEDFVKDDRYGAARIARTETIWAWNAGAVQGYVQSGVVTKKVWVSSGDDRSCDFCPELDGKVIDIEADFFSKGDSWPGGGLSFDYCDVGHPPLHPMCRCSIAPEIEVI